MSTSAIYILGKQCLRGCSPSLRIETSGDDLFSVLKRYWVLSSTIGADCVWCGLLRRNNTVTVTVTELYFEGIWGSGGLQLCLIHLISTSHTLFSRLGPGGGPLG